MTSPAFVSVIDVRNLLQLEAAGTSLFTDDLITSNIRAASEYLEQATDRYFGERTGLTLTFTSNGDSVLALPGIRSVGGITRAGSALTANETYWLLPDDQQSGVFTGIQFQAFISRLGRAWWLSVPEWFDRNLDSPYNPANYGGGYGSLPNDIVMTNVTVGYANADLPEMLRVATKYLAGAMTVYGPSVLTGTMSTPEGNSLATTAWDFAQTFISQWRIGDVQAVSL
jgi:hypothetical protein